jgi:hypothetical protein
VGYYLALLRSYLPATIFQNGAASSCRAKQMRVDIFWSAEQRARKLFRRLQIADAGHCQQRQDVRHVMLAQHGDMGFAQGNLETVIHLIFFAVSHFDQKGNALVNRYLHSVSCHNGSNLMG